MGSFHNLGASMMQSCLRAPMAPMLPSGDTGQSSIKRGLRHTTPAFEAAQSEAIGVQREGGGYAGVFCNHSLPRCHSRLGPRHSLLCRQTPPDKNRNPVQIASMSQSQNPFSWAHIPALLRKRLGEKVKETQKLLRRYVFLRCGWHEHCASLLLRTHP